MKILNYISILILILITVDVNAKILTDEDVKRSILFTMVDKSYNMNTKFNIKTSEDLKCSKGNKINCKLSELTIRNKSIEKTKLIKTFKAKKISILLNNPVVNNQEIINESNKLWEARVIEIRKEENQNLKKKLLRRKGIELMTFKNRINYEKIKGFITKIYFNTPSLEIDNNNFKNQQDIIARQMVINFEEETLTLKDINKKFFIKLYKNEIKKELKKFKRNTKFKGMKKVLAAKKITNKIDNIEILVKDIINFKEKIDITYSFKDKTINYSSKDINFQFNIESVTSSNLKIEKEKEISINKYKRELKELGIFIYTLITKLEIELNELKDR